MFGIEKVEIKRTDWHFRFMEWLRLVKVGRGSSFNRQTARWEYGDIYHAPKSICPYFWLLVFGLFFVGIVSIIFLVFLGAVGLGIYLLALAIIHNLRDALEILAIIVGSIALVGSIIFITNRMYIPWLDRRRNRMPKPRKPYRPNIFTAFIKAKKNKVCPLIDYT